MENLRLPLLPYQADPIRRTLESVGPKWTLLILRDISFLKLRRFNQILHNNDGLTPRALSKRLSAMVEEGMLERIEEGAGIRYQVTPKGEDAAYILLAILRYGLKHHQAEPGSPTE